MSFYGNITNTARTQFQFDRIYANRVEMESNKETDGIYAGRFVLIEYDNEMHLDTLKRVFIEDDKFYIATANKTSQYTLLNESTININEIVYETAIDIDPSKGNYIKDCSFYKCIGFRNGVAQFEQIVGKNEDILHITNYTIDNEKYKRGYDSTVWQKVYDGGIERYMMIAELNTVIPVFDLQPDAPTQTPIVPHFDTEGSNLYHRLHHQPTWGLRVKSAQLEQGPEFENNGETKKELIYYSDIKKFPYNGYASDETTQWTREEYNPDTGKVTTLYWHSGNKGDSLYSGKWELTPPEKGMPAAIYYNKDGFNPSIISESDLEDHINIEGTGFSGHQYTDHANKNQKNAQADIQEISVILPSIGNSISHMWDLIYGDKIINNSNNRNLDIAWDSHDGLRLVSGDSTNGFKYNKDQVSTLAGAINSVHDLMGMIIIDAPNLMDEDFAKNADDNKIYYYDNNYYRRVNKYKYDEDHLIGSDIEDYQLGENELDEISYKEVPPFNQFPPVNENFYYGTAGNEYYLEQKEYPTYNRTYYATNNQEDFFNVVKPIEFNQNIHYKFIDTENSHTYDDTVVELGYFINDDNAPQDNEIYYEIFSDEIIRVDGIPYIPGKYYICNVKGYEGKEITPEMENTLTLSDIIISNDEYNEETVYYDVTIQAGELFLKKVNNIFGVTKNHYYKHNNSIRYYRCSKDFIPDEENILENLNQYTFYTIPEKTSVDYFYKYGTYYIYDEIAKKYKICNEENLNNNLTYYLISTNIRVVDLIKEGYYVSDTYYYTLSNGKKVIDKNETPSAEKYYLKDKSYYVYQDANHVMSIGMEWNVKVTTIPKGIKITTRENIPAMEKINGFARELNTIHGLILQINKLLLTNDIHTRDSYTLQGALNVINDIIDKFEIIAPGQFVIIDDYGRVHSATHSEDDWIDIEIDSNVINPNVSITHKFNPTSDTTSTSSQDIDNSDGNIELYTPKVDNKGHVIGKNIETIELPHNFKTIKVGNTLITANNHIANVNVTDDNNWIEVSADADTDTLTISHIGPVSGGTTTYNTNETPKFGGSFNVPTITYDSKGHISASNNHTVTLPTLSLTNDASGNVLTGLTLDISNTTGNLTLTKESVGTLALGGTYSIATSESAISNSDTINAALGKLEYKINRNIGSLTLGTYAANNSTAAISNSDSIELALRKLENRIKKLEK